MLMSKYHIYRTITTGDKLLLHCRCMKGEMWRDRIIWCTSFAWFTYRDYEVLHKIFFIYEFIFVLLFILGMLYLKDLYRFRSNWFVLKLIRQSHQDQYFFS